MKTELNEIKYYLDSLVMMIANLKSSAKTMSLFFNSLDEKYRYVDENDFKIIRMSEERTKMIFGTSKLIIELIHIEPGKSTLVVKPHTHKNVVIQTALGIQHGFPKPDTILISGFNIPGTKIRLRLERLIAGFNIYHNPGTVHGFTIYKETWMIRVSYHQSANDKNNSQLIENYEIVDNQLD